MPPARPWCRERVFSVASLCFRVRPEARGRLGSDDLVDHGRIGPRVEVVHELRALVTEVARVLEADRPMHGGQASGRAHETSRRPRATGGRERGTARPAPKRATSPFSQLFETARPCGADGTSFGEMSSGGWRGFARRSSLWPSGQPPPESHILDRSVGPPPFSGDDIEARCAHPAPREFPRPTDVRSSDPDPSFRGGYRPLHG